MHYLIKFFYFVYLIAKKKNNKKNICYKFYNRRKKNVSLNICNNLHLNKHLTHFKMNG